MYSPLCKVRGKSQVFMKSFKNFIVVLAKMGLIFKSLGLDFPSTPFPSQVGQKLTIQLYLASPKPLQPLFKMLNKGKVLEALFLSFNWFKRGLGMYQGQIPRGTKVPVFP